MKLDRRSFLKSAAVAGGSAMLWGLVGNASTVFAAQPTGDRPDGFAMLSDTTRCTGCRRCEMACSKVNDLPEPEIPIDDLSVFNEIRRTDAQVYTVVNRYEYPEGSKPIFRKKQCMHCAEPACASACLVGALKKTPEGAVLYNEDVCIGCRYCMTACPFYIPAFEYFDARSPAISKCTMCYPRISKGGIPACASVCATEATVFGKRSDLIELARERIKSEPNRYINHIYGEHEVGGTDWLYISGVPFDKLDLPLNVETTPYPTLTQEFLSSVPVVLAILPALLGGFYVWSKKRERSIENELTKEEKDESER